MKKLSTYCVAITLLSVSTLSFSMWRQFTRRVQSVVPTAAEARQIALRNQGQFQGATRGLYNAVSNLNQYRNKELNLLFFAENPNFINDLNAAVEAAQKAKKAAFDFKKTAEQVKGETWQRGLVEEPAAMSEITIDDDNYLVIQQPKAPTSSSCPVYSDWEVLDDFDGELE